MSSIGAQHKRGTAAALEDNDAWGHVARNRKEQHHAATTRLPPIATTEGLGHEDNQPTSNDSALIST